MYSRYYKRYRETVNVSYALIADIVRSRELPDRRRAQQVIYEALERAAEGLALTQSPYACSCPKGSACASASAPE